MSQTYYTLITDTGAALLAQATATQVPLKIAALAVGDGNGSVPKPTASQKALINEVRRGIVNTIYTNEDSKNNIIVEQVIPPDEGGFYIRELALFDDKGNMIAIGNCPPSYKPKLSEGSGRTQVINMIIMIDNTGTVELKIDSRTVLATRKYVDSELEIKIKTHENSTNHPDATTESKGMVKLNSATNSDDETTAATPKAVKTAYDLAATSVQLTTDENGKKTVNEPTDFKKLTQAGSSVVTKANFYDTLESVVLYPNGSADNLPILTVGKRIVTANPFNTMNIVVFTELYLTDETDGVSKWGRVQGCFYYAPNGGWGLYASPLGDSSIIVQAGSYRLVDVNSKSDGAPWNKTKDNITSAPYRVRVFKLGE